MCKLDVLGWVEKDLEQIQVGKTFSPAVRDTDLTVLAAGCVRLVQVGG